MTSGVREFDKLIDPTKVQFNQPEIVEMLQIMVSDVFNGDTRVSPTPADMEGGSNALETGNVAMKYEGPWFFGRLDNPELRDERQRDRLRLRDDAQRRRWQPQTPRLGRRRGGTCQR